MRATVVVGVVTVLFGFVVVVQRGLAGLLQLNYAFVTLVGVLALVQGLRFANEGTSVERRAVETADVEERYRTPVPGDDVDALVSNMGGSSRSTIKQRREFHRRLVDAARETLRARGDYGEADADAAISAGTWTRDPVAAWFLGDDRHSPPLSVRLRGMFGSHAEFNFATTRTIAALAALRTDEQPVPDEVPQREQGRWAFVEAARDAGRRRFGAVRDRIARVRR